MSWFTTLFKKSEATSTYRADVITVLVVDGSPIVRKTFETMFQEEMYRVASAANEDDARARLIDVLPDVVFIDAGLLERGGASLCRFIKEQPKMKPKTVFLLVPAFAPFADELARRVGANGCFRKPLESIKKVIDAVNAVGSRRENNREHQPGLQP